MPPCPALGQGVGRLAHAVDVYFAGKESLQTLTESVFIVKRIEEAFSSLGDEARCSRIFASDDRESMRERFSYHDCHAFRGRRHDVGQTCRIVTSEFRSRQTRDVSEYAALVR